VATTADQIYREHIKALPAVECLELISLIARELAAERDASQGAPKHSLTEILRSDMVIGRDIDAQEYVNLLRDERW
jgi:hypothetical protein